MSLMLVAPILIYFPPLEQFYIQIIFLSLKFISKEMIAGGKAFLGTSVESFL